MTTTTVSCDICKGPNAKPFKNMPVCFMTEQTEGRYTTPHLSLESMDMCVECHDKLVNSLPLIGEGAQGFNRYAWRKA